MILDGKTLAKENEEKLKKDIEILKEKYGKVPTLATILVGDNPASITYVRMKENACKRVGIDSVHVELSSSISEEELVNKIKELNDNPDIDGILLQHPIPKNIDESRCFDSIGINKDVDGVNTASFGAFSNGKEAFKSATPLGIIKLIEHYNIEVEGKHAVVVGRSAILGKPVSMLLLEKNATVTIAHSKTKNLENLLKQADIVVACVGKPEFIKKEWLKPGVVILDAGYNPGNVGDVEKGAYEIASAYTPVPGGVGPMTINMLLTQTVESFRRKMEKNH
jgi:methylenetetrahydrofolate dehydrogenase (NADP+)/methenyltetrahydrofolate cyclohydrolase